ncbi:carbohydrate ABC transporter permease [Paenibacillus sp. F411]|uniref:carbohydrate ABC transporter permease n=1 Tax=Paenibacillus sp. F411 TaxID=2820239 RepID=UPI001AAF20D5|nr:carbohydrate ABC transporter permease [Paenibacillus sp. F411]MBO2942419.1 carbohydrate ABC transporter permease [Paenibacillus sp. F411]
MQTTLKKGMKERAFDLFNTLFLLTICLTVILPFLYIIAGSLSSSKALINNEVLLWPVDFSMENYVAVMQNDIFWRAFGVTIFVVTVGTLINMIITVLMSYPLSKMWLRGRRLIMLILIFTMIFQAPLIPTYLVVKELSLLNTVWALIIPTALSVFNVILCMTFMRSLPEELFDAAKMDGMTELGILSRIVLPLSKPIMVTLLLFYAVGHWNNYFTALMYITNPSIRPLQLYLYSLIVQSDVNETMASISESAATVSPQGLQMATILVSTIPIVILYPLLQKHFIKGAMLGSVKE